MSIAGPVAGPEPAGAPGELPPGVSYHGGWKRYVVELKGYGYTRKFPKDQLHRALDWRKKALEAVDGLEEDRSLKYFKELCVATGLSAAGNKVVLQSRCVQSAIDMLDHSLEPPKPPAAPPGKPAKQPGTSAEPVVLTGLAQQHVPADCLAEDVTMCMWEGGEVPCPPVGPANAMLGCFSNCEIAYMWLLITAVLLLPLLRIL